MPMEECVKTIKQQIKLKAAVDVETVLDIARRERRLQDSNGSLLERVYGVAVEYGIDTGWEAPSPRLWIGRIPVGILSQ